MNDQDMYKNLAKYYDKIYHLKDYEKEVKALKKIISENKNTTGNNLLDCACGTGSHLKFFTDEYICTGIDLNSRMLDIAKNKGIKANFIQANMIHLDLGKKFDVITCLFSSIGYIVSKEDVKKTIAGFAAHLKPGGLLIIEPWLTKEIYQEGSPHMTTFDGKNLKIARLNISELKGNLSIIKMHYLIAESNRPVMHFIDTHKLAMFPIEFFIEIMKEFGLKAKLVKKGLFNERGLLIGIK